MHICLYTIFQFIFRIFAMYIRMFAHNKSTPLQSSPEGKFFYLRDVCVYKVPSVPYVYLLQKRTCVTCVQYTKYRRYLTRTAFVMFTHTKINEEKTINVNSLRHSVTAVILLYYRSPIYLTDKGISCYRSLSIPAPQKPSHFGLIIIYMKLYIHIPKYNQRISIHYTI